MAHKIETHREVEITAETIRHAVGGMPVLTTRYSATPKGQKVQSDSLDRIKKKIDGVLDAKD
jgi:hypothetical protein